MYLMNCFMDELGGSYDNITIEAFPNRYSNCCSQVLSPNPSFISYSWGPLKVARTSLAPISRSSLPLNKLVINTAKFPRKAIPIAGKLADPVTLSLNSNCTKAIFILRYYLANLIFLYNYYDYNY
jgi:hypothetical protein